MTLFSEVSGVTCGIQSWFVLLVRKHIHGSLYGELEESALSSVLPSYD